MKLRSTHYTRRRLGRTARRSGTHAPRVSREYNGPVTTARTWIALALGKQAAFWSRRLRRGGGEALPGLLAERVSPGILAELTGALPQGVVVVTGTNGKTTTSLAISLVLAAQGLSVLRNKGGSNLTRGLVSALIETSRLTRPRPSEDIALFEVDEATMPQAIACTHPRVILVTNVFRDQLDRYGEIDKTAALIRAGIDRAPDATLVLNADDPMVAALGRGRSQVVYFGLEDTDLSARTELAIDAADCPVCGSPLAFAQRYFSHVGHFSCPACGFERPPCQVRADHVQLTSEGARADVTVNGATYSLTSQLSGLYNLYNFLAAVAATGTLGVDAASALAALSTMRPAFGRLERFRMDQRTGIIHLVKNPTGFNQVIDNVTTWGQGEAVLLCLNDNFADGTDISWIWDVDFAPLSRAFSTLVVSGLRAPELALRLKYAGAPEDRVRLMPDLIAALETAVRVTPPEGVLNILTTYTAMLELRAHLVRRGLLEDYWK